MSASDARPAGWPVRRAWSIAWPGWRRIRQAVQILSLAFYVYLLFAALDRRPAFPLADLFFRLNPLAALGAMMAGRAWISRLAPALVTLGLTLALGRIWCGWLCPLGTLLGWLSFEGAAQRAGSLSPRWRSAKNLLLLAIVAAALLGNLSLLVLDPLALLTRTAATAVLPALNHAVTALEVQLYTIPALVPAVDWAGRYLRGPVLPVEQAAFAQNVAIAAFFAGLVALNALADRFWCRYLCPLGALLGLLAKVSLLRPLIGRACNRCARCDAACRMGAIEAQQGYTIVPAECTLCLDCLAVCPAQENGLRLHRRPDRWRQYDPTRRQLVGGLVAGLAGVALLQTGIHSEVAYPFLVRPPGAGDEGTFLARCLRCGQCMRVCPTAGLQPALFEAGIEGLWTPRLLPRLGHCDYGCRACGQVCPSGAIAPLTLAQKRQAVIGLAAIDRNRCLPWAYEVPCIVCEEMCPVPEKAIRIEEVTVTDKHGHPVTLHRPYVREDLCIGCGICERRCPMGGQAAIRVYHHTL